MKITNAPPTLQTAVCDNTLIILNIFLCIKFKTMKITTYCEHIFIFFEKFTINILKIRVRRYSFITLRSLSKS